MAMGADAGTGKAVSGINVAPLIDVLLVLLIIFLVIVPVTPKGLSSEVPKPSRQGTSSLEDAIVLQVTQESPGRLSYFLNQSPLPKPEIVRSLSRVFSTRQSRVIFVKADPRVPYATVTELIDMAHMANIDEIGLLTPGLQRLQ